MNTEVLQIIKELSDKTKNPFLKKAAVQGPEDQCSPQSKKIFPHPFGGIKTKSRNIRDPKNYIYEIPSTAAKRFSFSDSNEGRYCPTCDSGRHSTGYKTDQLLRTTFVCETSGLTVDDPHILFANNMKARLDAQIMNKKPEKRSRIRKLFRGYQQAGTRDSSFSMSVPAHNTETAVPTTTTNNLLLSQDEDQSRGLPDPEGRAIVVLGEEGHRESPNKES
ncbi:hypothetical protein AYI68_g1475 [Smittium mucronatum]|uniref:Uncharacterized protein n=1 Tax=Smittium mucronatum TaxID=133383 RepID=A0A1R0H5K8_9FUNG|nr:hypothetical protein AYI68_g1475 [Smittium mucronatum]